MEERKDKVFMNEAIFNFIDEMQKRFDEEGNIEKPEEWMKNVLRKDLNLSDEEAEKVAKELLDGIERYNEVKEKKLTIKSVLESAGKFSEDIYNKIISELKSILLTLFTKPEERLEDTERKIENEKKIEKIIDNCESGRR
jgi:predicted nucleotidyltransferase